MKEFQRYISQILRINVQPELIPKEHFGRLPIFIGETYRLYKMAFFSRELVLAEPRSLEDFSILQTDKHFDLLKEVFHKTVVLVLEELPAYNRKRLIEKGINFIVPGKQLFLPDLFMDLSERFNTRGIKKKEETLLPSAQFLLIYHIIHRYEKWKLEDHPFKEIAEKLGYTPMAITNAINNLKYHEIVDVIGEREKRIKFRLERGELWRDTEQRKLWTNPIWKRVYTDVKPQGTHLYSNRSALHEYSDMNPSRQTFYAIGKNEFFKLQKRHRLASINETEGEYCLEVWKYDPEALVAEMPNNTAVVDPLSLYLSLKDSQDERTEIALEQIIEKYTW